MEATANGRNLPMEELFTLDELIARGRDFERAQLRKVFRDGYADSMRMTDLVRHFQQQACEHSFQDDARYQTLDRNLTSFSRRMGSLINGVRGERYARRAISRLHVPCESVENAYIERGDRRRARVDQIVLTKFGIFIVEVKFYTPDVEIDDCGILWQISRHGRRRQPYDVAGHLREMECVLEETLRDSDERLPLEGNIHSILCLANDRSAFKDSFGRYEVCRCGNLPFVIEDACVDRVFSTDQVARMTETVKDACGDARMLAEFDLNALSGGIDYVLGLIEADSLSEQPEPVPCDLEDLADGRDEESLTDHLNVMPEKPWRRYVPQAAAVAGLILGLPLAIRGVSRLMDGAQA